MKEAVTFIKNEEELYDIYEDLNCYDIKPNMYKINRFGDVVNKYTNYKLSSRNKRNGYTTVGMRTDSNSDRNYLQHRLVAETFCYKPEGKNIVNHIDSVRDNNFWLNLEWCTQKENMLHARIYGNSKVRGEDNGNSRFSNNEIHQICKMMEEGVQYKNILFTLGKEDSTKNLDILTKIKSKHIWKHISDLYNIQKPEYRTTQIKYSVEELEQICQWISDGYSNREISNFLNIDMSIKKESDKFYKFIQRIRYRQSFTDISNKYNW